MPGAREVKKMSMGSWANQPGPLSIGSLLQTNEIKLGPYTKLSFKWIKDLNIKIKPYKNKKEKSGRIFKKIIVEKAF